MKERPTEGWLSDADDAWFWHHVIIMFMKWEESYHITCDGDQEYDS